MASAVKKTTLYQERNEEKRKEFKQKLETLNPAKIVYVDESGLQENIHREYGRAEKGKKIYGNVPGKRTRPTSIIAGLSQGKVIAPFYFEGHCNTEVVLTWLKKVLLPELTPGMTIIWDNASFHQSQKLKDEIESAGCRLEPLPSYSPDFNPIEQWWSALKARIRRIRTPKMTLKRALCKAIRIAH